MKKNDSSHTVTAELETQLSPDLIGRYTCSETINGEKYVTSVYVFIADDKSVFTKRDYPIVFKKTGIHFFNIPCQARNWYARMTCPNVSDSTKCENQICNEAQKRKNELRCYIQKCAGKDICIPVSYTPADIQASVCLIKFEVDKEFFRIF